MKQFVRAEGDYLMYRVPRTCFERCEHAYVDSGREAVIVRDGTPSTLLRAGDQAPLHSNVLIGQTQLYFFNKLPSSSIALDIGDLFHGSCRIRVSNAPLLLANMQYVTGRLSAREMVQYMHGRLDELAANWNDSPPEQRRELTRQVRAEFERFGVEACEICERGSGLTIVPVRAETGGMSLSNRQARARTNRRSRNELANLLLDVRRDAPTTHWRDELHAIENRLMLSETSSRSAALYDAQIRELALKLPEIASKGMSDIFESYVVRISQLVDRRAM